LIRLVGWFRFAGCSLKAVDPQHRLRLTEDHSFRKTGSHDDNRTSAETNAMKNSKLLSIRFHQAPCYCGSQGKAWRFTPEQEINPDQLQKPQPIADCGFAKSRQ
jgi:hypothetical protein